MADLRVDVEGIPRDQGFQLVLDCILGLKAKLLAREVPGAQLTGWLDLPEAARSHLDEFFGAAERLRCGGCCVVVGIGGSYLGARAAYEALGRQEGGAELLWAGWSLSAVQMARLLQELESRDFTLQVISKSGETMEPASALRILLERLRHRYGQGWRQRVVVTTDPTKGALRAWAQAEGLATLPVPPSVGGRFSVLSAVGLVPMAVARIDVEAVVAGAQEARDGCVGPGEDPASLYAAARCLLEQRGKWIEVMAVPGPELAQFGEWWRQLAGESEGKAGAGIWPSVLVLTTDLHSVGQYVQEGRRVLQETFLLFDEGPSQPTIPPCAVEDGLQALEGRPLALLNSMAAEGTREAHRAGDVPGCTVRVPRLDAANLGKLFFFFQMAVALTALFHGVNPFDQPGVEAYKRRVRARFDTLTR